MNYTVYTTEEAEEDLQRLADFLIAIALERNDFDLPGRAMAAIRSEMRVLENNPFTCRMADGNSYERELLIPFGGTGYVALFQVLSEHEVVITAVRHQREDDYH